VELNLAEKPRRELNCGKTIFAEKSKELNCGKLILTEKTRKVKLWKAKPLRINL